MKFSYKSRRSSANSVQQSRSNSVRSENRLTSKQAELTSSFQKHVIQAEDNNKEERDDLVLPLNHSNRSHHHITKRRHSEYGRFLTPGKEKLQQFQNNNHSIDKDVSDENENIDNIQNIEQPQENDDDVQSDSRKSPSQSVPRRRAVDTSDLRSCALVQSKLKTHRSSWKSIDGMPLWVINCLNSFESFLFTKIL